MDLQLWIVALPSALEDVLFTFLRVAFSERDLEGVWPDFCDAVERMGENPTLDAASIAAWPESAQAALKHFLTDWLMAVYLTEESDGPYAFPESELEGCSATRLNERVVGEILACAAPLEILFHCKRIASSRARPRGL